MTDRRTRQELPPIPPDPHDTQEAQPVVTMPEQLQNLVSRIIRDDGINLKVHWDEKNKHPWNRQMDIVRIAEEYLADLDGDFTDPDSVIVLRKYYFGSEKPGTNDTYVFSEDVMNSVRKFLEKNRSGIPDADGDELTKYLRILNISRPKNDDRLLMLSEIVDSYSNHLQSNPNHLLNHLPKFIEAVSANIRLLDRIEGDESKEKVRKILRKLESLSANLREKYGTTMMRRYIEMITTLIEQCNETMKNPF